MSRCAHSVNFMTQCLVVTINLEICVSCLFSSITPLKKGSIAFCLTCAGRPSLISGGLKGSFVIGLSSKGEMWTLEQQGMLVDVKWKIPTALGPILKSHYYCAMGDFGIVAHLHVSLPFTKVNWANCRKQPVSFIATVNTSVSTTEELANVLQLSCWYSDWT